MHLKELGKTGIEVSAVGFGASPLGNVFGDVSLESGKRAVAKAIDGGINVFDVSPYYGLTLAEERLGESLKGRRSSIYLATKCGRYGADEFDFSAATIIREFERSLQRLQTDYVDILQAHDIEFGPLPQILEETLPAMAKLKEEGKVRFVGATSYWPGLLAKVVSRFDLDCVLNYCHANVFVDDMQEELVPEAATKRVGIFNASPLHMGLLSGKPVPGWHPAPVEVREAAAQVAEIVRQFGIDPAIFGMRYALENTAVASTFVGISNEAEIAAALQAQQADLPDALLRAVGSIIAPVHNTVWPSGLPENQGESLRLQERAYASAG